MSHNANRTPIDPNQYHMSFGSQHSHSMSQPSPYPMVANSHPQTSQSHNGSVQSPFKSFTGQDYGSAMRTSYEKPQIYTAVYSGVQVYEMEVNGVACMRRRSDGWLNATQILKVAGVDKGKRTKVLEKEILTGEHEKVQGGYGKYQGTWINYRRGREFCRQYGVEDALRPLLEYDLNGDGTGGQTNDTPTKEQAMAANRKRFYNSALDQRNGPPSTQSTFFQNISPMSHIALAAMNKAARLNSPARPTPQKRTSMQPSASQQSMASENSFAGDAAMDSGYGTQNGGAQWRGQAPGQEPLRKRMRPSEDLPVDASLMSIDPTEPSESFIYGAQQYADQIPDGDEPVTLPPLPAPSTPQQEEKKALLLDLFADPTRVDFSSHPALIRLSSEDLNIPLDTSANTALHWAATLSRIPLLRLLIQKGSNIWRGNAAGQSALISAVLVNNCWEHSSFPDVLELLGPLIEVRDAQGRTILHHVAVSCGIKGRAPSSKYYLEVLLEFLVRSVSHSAGLTAAAAANGETTQDQEPIRSTKGPMSLMRFLTHIVNARDKAGNTALNLVARIGNRSIIQQLLEIRADPSLANFKGVSARDFGVGVEDGDPITNGAAFHGSHNIDPAFDTKPSTQPATAGAVDGEEPPPSGEAEDQNQDVISSLTTMLTQNLAQHKQLLADKALRIDELNTQIRDLSSVQKTESDQLSALQKRARLRNERMQKIANLRRIVEETRRSRNANRRSPQKKQNMAVGAADSGIATILTATAGLRQNVDEGRDELTPELRHALSLLPPLPQLRALAGAYEANNARLADDAATLQSKSVKLEELYRKVVSLCTGVPEARVEESLGALVAAVESEKGGLGREEVVRVREFLMKVEGVGSADV
ncbi:hypothetical protein MBLNU459_g8031t1 [Dothideomycetes sp. NU459]